MWPVILIFSMVQITFPAIIRHVTIRVQVLVSVCPKTVLRNAMAVLTGGWYVPTFFAEWKVQPIRGVI
jgi:hypothetical protein